MSEAIRCAVITGASSGMGASCAREFAKAGFRVVVAGRNAFRAKQITDEIGADAPLIGWSARAYDGTAGASPNSVVRRIEAGLRPGAIVLLHDAAENDDFAPAAVEALPRILESLRERGLSTVTVEQLLGLKS